MAPDATGPQAALAPLTRRQILVIIAGLLLGMLLAALDQTIVATALPTIAGDLHGLAERGAAEPVLPLHLFRQRVFSAAEPSASWWGSPCSAR